MSRRRRSGRHAHPATVFEPMLDIVALVAGLFTFRWAMS